jgi:hypothetical protein
MSNQWDVVDLSTTKAGYMVATHSCKETIWLKRWCSYIRFKQGVVIIYCDSQSVICLAKNLKFHARTKHIDLQYHFVRDMVEDGRVNLFKVETLMNVVDSLNKPMIIEKYEWCVDTMGFLAPSN